MGKKKREKKKKKSLEFRTSSPIKQEGVQINDFPVPLSQHRTFDESRPSGLRRRKAPTFENDFIVSANNDFRAEMEAETIGIKEFQGDFGYPPTLEAKAPLVGTVLCDDYEDVEIEAAGATVPYSHEDEEIDASLKQSGSTTISTNEDEQDNVRLSSEESELVSAVGLIDYLSIGHLELKSAIQDKNDIHPTVRFPGNENFSCIEIEEDTSNDMRQMNGQVVREKKINDVRASLGSNEIEKSCGGVHFIKNENSNDDHEAHKRNCGNQKDALEWIFMITSFLLELPSAFLDHLASVQKPQYALCGILISVAALLICIVELIFKARIEKVTWKWRGRLLPCFYSRHNQKLFHTFKDNIIGVVVAFCQFIIITINYAFLRQGAGKPIQICVWPIIFGLGQICSKIL